MMAKEKPRAVDRRKAGDVVKVEITVEMRNWLRTIANHRDETMFEALEAECRTVLFKAFRKVVLEQHGKVTGGGA